MRLRPLLIPIILLALAQTPAFAQVRELPIALHRQHTNAWCWAAAIAMVVEYYQDFGINDCLVLTEESIRDGGRGMCCAFPDDCRRKAELEEVTGVMSRIYGLSGELQDRPLPAAEARREIDQGRPFIAVLDRDEGSGGHIVVITGYDEGDRFVVLDPDSGRLVLDYRTMLTVPRPGKWKHTFVFTSRRAKKPLCRTYREPIPGAVREMRMERVRVKCEKNPG